MKALIQRVKWSKVSSGGSLISEINAGLLILLGIEHSDGMADIDWLCSKIVNMRIFADHLGKMNLDVKTINGDIMLISQFTLHAATAKGNRPSFIAAAKPEEAKKLYQIFINKLNILHAKTVKTGIFGADMQIELCNDGPVTIIIDSKNRC